MNFVNRYQLALPQTKSLGIQLYSTYVQRVPTVIGVIPLACLVSMVSCAQLAETSVLIMDAPKAAIASQESRPNAILGNTV